MAAWRCWRTAASRSKPWWRPKRCARAPQDEDEHKALPRGKRGRAERRQPRWAEQGGHGVVAERKHRAGLTTTRMEPLAGARGGGGWGGAAGRRNRGIAVRWWSLTLAGGATTCGGVRSRSACYCCCCCEWARERGGERETVDGEGDGARTWRGEGRPAVPRSVRALACRDATRGRGRARGPGPAKRRWAIREGRGRERACGSGRQE
jgi:hypothetical protein